MLWSPEMNAGRLELGIDAVKLVVFETDQEDLGCPGVEYELEEDILADPMVPLRLEFNACTAGKHSSRKVLTKQRACKNMLVSRYSRYMLTIGFLGRRKLVSSTLL